MQAKLLSTFVVTKCGLNVRVVFLFDKTANAEDLFGDADDISSVSSHGDGDAEGVCIFAIFRSQLHIFVSGKACNQTSMARFTICAYQLAVKQGIVFDCVHLCV